MCFDSFFLLLCFDSLFVCFGVGTILLIRRQLTLCRCPILKTKREKEKNSCAILVSPCVYLMTTDKQDTDSVESSIIDGTSSSHCYTNLYPRRSREQSFGYQKIESIRGPSEKCHGSAVITHYDDYVCLSFWVVDTTCDLGTRVVIVSTYQFVVRIPCPY